MMHVTINIKCTYTFDLIVSSFLHNIRLAPGYSVSVGTLQCGQLSRKGRVVVAVDGTWHDYTVSWEKWEGRNLLGKPN